MGTHRLKGPSNMMGDLQTRAPSDPRALSITLDDLRCTVKALVVAESSYFKLAASAKTAIGRNEAVNDSRECRQLRDRLRGYLACFDPK